RAGRPDQADTRAESALPSATASSRTDRRRLPLRRQRGAGEGRAKGEGRPCKHAAVCIAVSRFLRAEKQRAAESIPAQAAWHEGQRAGHVPAPPSGGKRPCEPPSFTCFTATATCPSGIMPSRPRLGGRSGSAPEGARERRRGAAHQPLDGERLRLPLLPHVEGRSRSG